jgi:tetratricopeptide (TPR) repeat protein
LDSACVRCNNELGDISLYHDFNWERAEQAYLKAHRLAPSDPDVLTGLGDHQQALGRCKESEQYYRMALTFNPLKPIIYLDLGNALSCNGRFSEAIPIFNKILEIDPKFQRAHLYIGRNYLLMGQPAKALAEMEKENLEIFRSFGLALAYHALGQKQEADERLKSFIETYGNDWSYLVAELLAFRGEKDKALTWLETAYTKKDSWLYWIKCDPLLSNIIDESRYKAILAKLNLPVDN